MKDILLRHGDDYIECELNGLELSYTYSDDPKCHCKLELIDRSSYRKFKNTINNIYDSYDDKDLGYDVVRDFLQSYDMDEFFKAGTGVIEWDIRDREEINEYLDEAFDKVWLMRTRPCDEYPDIEADRQIAVRRILNSYDDIPNDRYSDWECGYWNGIMGALRWVLGNEKDFLDT